MITEKRKQRILSELQPIAPQWANVLERQDGKAYLAEPNDKLNIHNPARCIVGEAHGFDGMYGIDITDEFCQTCERAATDVVGITVGHTYEDREILVRYNKTWTDLDKFTKHFKRCHTKMITAKRKIALLQKLELISPSRIIHMMDSSTKSEER